MDEAGAFLTHVPLSALTNVVSDTSLTTSIFLCSFWDYGSQRGPNFHLPHLDLQVPELCVCVCVCVGKGSKAVIKGGCSKTRSSF